jgi:small subunit ribosomal protein S8
MLTRIRNALMAKHSDVTIPASRLKRRVAEILKEEGYIRDFKQINDNKQGMLHLQLKYGQDKISVISNLQRISKPSRRIYVGKDEVPSVLNGLGIAILSTSKGIMTDRDARKAGVGGEVLCYVW